MVHPRTRLLATAVLAMALCPALAGPLDGTDEISDEAKQTMLDMRITAAVLLACADESTGVPASEKEFVSLDTLTTGIDSIYRKRLVLRDAWGNRILFLGEPDSFALVSVGPDGKPDARFEDLVTGSQYGFSASSPSGADDIVLVNGEFIRRPMTKRERTFALQKRTMADIRSIGTAVEQYAIDNNVYPSLAGGLAPLEGLRSLVEPVYIRTLPMTDGWGHPLLIWSNGTGYLIVSPGSDGLLDRTYDLADEPSSAHDSVGGFIDPEIDILFVNGQFVQWPDATRQ